MARLCQRCYSLDEITEIWDHLRCAAGKIDGWNLAFPQPIDNAVDRLARHDFLALWPGVHVAVHTGQIAKLADVDLKNLRMPAAQRDRALRQLLCEPIHGRTSELTTAAVALHQRRTTREQPDDNPLRLLHARVLFSKGGNPSLPITLRKHVLTCCQSIIIG